MRALGALLNGADGVTGATADAHGQANLIRVRLTIDADGPHEALDHACGHVHRCVASAGLGKAVLVAARHLTATAATGRRMG
jgi:hypothetical protein